MRRPEFCLQCGYKNHAPISCYWNRLGKTLNDRVIGRQFTRSNGSLGCAECCNGDHCDDSTHKFRDNCPYCLGTGTSSPPQSDKEK